MSTFNPFKYIDPTSLEDAKLSMAVYCDYDNDERHEVVEALNTEELVAIHMMLGAIILYQLVNPNSIASGACIKDLANRLITAHGTSFLN